MSVTSLQSSEFSLSTRNIEMFTYISASPPRMHHGRVVRNHEAQVRDPQRVDTGAISEGGR